MDDIEVVYHQKLNASKELLFEACKGKIGEHHKYMLQMIRKDIEQTQGLIDELTFRIKMMLAPYDSALNAICEIPGIERKMAEDLVAEISLDMEQFPTEKNLASWAGVCPGNNESAGKKKLKDQPREQASEIHHYGSCLGGDQNERHILQCKVSQSGGPQGKETGIDSSRTYDPEVHLAYSA